MLQVSPAPEVCALGSNFPPVPSLIASATRCSRQGTPFAASRALLTISTHSLALLILSASAARTMYLSTHFCASAPFVMVGIKVATHGGVGGRDCRPSARR